jgi:hypothetical protein
MGCQVLKKRGFKLRVDERRRTRGEEERRKGGEEERGVGEESSGES